MKPQTTDLTLLNFLQEFNIGTVVDTSPDVLIDFGHDAESAACTEILHFQLQREFEIGELPSLATAYLIRCGYDRVIFRKQSISGLLRKEKTSSEVFTDGGVSIAESSDMDACLIQVSHNLTAAVFAKLPFPSAQRAGME